MASTITSLSNLIMVLVLLVGFRGTMPQETKSIGVCYGMMGNNLPPPKEVVNLFVEHKWSKIRLYDPNDGALRALYNSRIQITLGTKNEDIPTLAAGVEQATAWYEKHIEPLVEGLYLGYVAVGNEAVPGKFQNLVPAAMKNLREVFSNRGLAETNVTTVVSSTILARTYPPSATVFTSDAQPAMAEILQILDDTGSPLLVNVYPYIAYSSDPEQIRLDYAQFTAIGPVVLDGGLTYYNLFDAMVDSFYWAIEKAGHANVNLIVAESGWPSAGNGLYTTPELAATYNNRYRDHIVGNRGTPKYPGRSLDGFVFALFNENLKPKGAEQNYGLFYPDMRPVYKF